jgi:hypothetical protein
MGETATLYEITKTEFLKIQKDISLFNIEESESMETLDQNVLAIEFILKKLFDIKYHEIINQIFTPIDFFGEKPDFKNLNFEEVDLFDLEDNSISYLTPEQILRITNLLNSITKGEIQEKYNSSELNKNGIYPRIWHDQESFNQSFNKRHIYEGFEQLVSIFNRANNNKNYIFVFNG